MAIALARTFAKKKAGERARGRASIPPVYARTIERGGGDGARRGSPRCAAPVWQSKPVAGANEGDRPDHAAGNRAPGPALRSPHVMAQPGIYARRCAGAGDWHWGEYRYIHRVQGVLQAITRCPRVRTDGQSCAVVAFRLERAVERSCCLVQRSRLRGLSGPGSFFQRAHCCEQPAEPDAHGSGRD